MSEAETFTAAFFRSVGKDVVTEKEFAMTVGINLQWIPLKHTAGLLKILVESGCISVKGGYVRPSIDTSKINVPVTYKPSEELRQMASVALMSGAEKPAPRPIPEKEHHAESKDVFSMMREAATNAGIDGKEFASACRQTSKRLGITAATAGLLILRDAGVDVTELSVRLDEELSRREA